MSQIQFDQRQEIGLPTIVGRYRILREIGRGSVGSVLLAKDPTLDREVALKIFHPMVMPADAAEEFRKRFMTEARASGRLNHPGIVTIYDAGVDAETDLQFIAMECIGGGSLEKLLRTRTLTTGEVAELGIQLATALDYAHRAGILHRDIKPGNILFTADGSAKLADFGIAKISGLDQTMAGAVVGTPSYMSPEQVRGLSLDRRSDLFSVGTVLLECLTGTNPFSADRLETTIYRIVHGEIPEFDVPEHAEQLVAVARKAMSRDREDRFLGGSEMAAALRRTAPASDGIGDLALNASEEPSDLDRTSATIVTRVEALVGSSKRRRLRLLAATAFSALALVVVFTLLWIAREPSDGNSEPGDRVAAAALRQDASPAAPGEMPLDEREPDPNLDSGARAANGYDEAQSARRENESSTGTAAAVEPRPQQPQSRLQFKYRNRLPRSWMTVWIDGEERWSKQLKLRSKARRIFGEPVQVEIEIAAGHSTVEVRLTSLDDEDVFDAAATLDGSFQAGDLYKLEIVIERKANRLSLGFE